MSFSSFSTFIDEKYKYENDGVETAKRNIKWIENSLEEIENITDIIYMSDFAQLNQRLDHANYNIDKFTQDKPEIIKKATDYMDNILEKNQHIKAIAEKVLAKLNKKYLKNRTLAHLSAKKLESLGMKEVDLPSPFKEVYTRNKSLIGGKKHNRKTKKRS
jgi:uncharacterized protein VirK/YbjX